MLMQVEAIVARKKFGHDFGLVLKRFFEGDFSRKSLISSEGTDRFQSSQFERVQYY